MFSHSLPLAERYADLLATAGVVRGLIGPREVDRLWQRHLLNCALLGRIIPEHADVCDVGTGAGLPGLVLALSRPDLQVTLVEPLRRRTTFLEEAVGELGLSNVEVVRGRAEALHGRRDFSVVTSRAVAPLGRLLDWSMPLVRQGGDLLAMKGSSAQEEIDGAAAELGRWGAGAVEVKQVAADGVDVPTTVIRVEATRPSRLGLAPQAGSPAQGAGSVRPRVAEDKSPRGAGGNSSQGASTKSPRAKDQVGRRAGRKSRTQQRKGRQG